MSRKTEIVIIPAAEGDKVNRDEGKRFRITEMSAHQAERWAARALLAIMRSGVVLPEGVRDLGLVGLANVAFEAFAGVRFEDAEPLLDEMIACAQIMPDPANADVVRPIIEGDIEEVSTLLLLRRRIMALQWDFSIPGAISTWTAPPGVSSTNTE